MFSLVKEVQEKAKLVNNDKEENSELSLKLQSLNEKLKKKNEALKHQVDTKKKNLNKKIVKNVK